MIAEAVLSMIGSQPYRPLSRHEDPSISSWMLAIGISLTCFSYPLTTIILKLAGTDVSFYNIIIKAVTAGLFILVFIARRRSFSVGSIALAPLMAFLVIYACRLTYDISVLGVRQGWSPAYYTLSYFFLLSFVPVFVLALDLKATDIARISTTAFWTLCAACLVVTGYVYFGGEIDSSEAFSGRVQIEGAVEGTALLGPIHIGLVGASLAAMSMGKLAFETNQTALTRFFLFGWLALGIANVMFSGSRGPLAGLAVAVLFLILAYILPRQGTSKLSVLAGLLMLVGPIALVYVISVSDTDSIYLFDRLKFFLEERAAGAREERDFIYQAAWLDFLENPVLGRSIVVSTTGFGAHNLILEVLMSTGIVGGAVFALSALTLTTAFTRILRVAAGSQAACTLLASVPIFALSMTSGSIAEGPALWNVYGLMSVIGAKFCVKSVHDLYDRRLSSQMVFHGVQRSRV